MARNFAYSSILLFEIVPLVRTVMSPQYENVSPLYAQYVTKRAAAHFLADEDYLEQIEDSYDPQILAEDLRRGRLYQDEYEYDLQRRSKVLQEVENIRTLFEPLKMMDSYVASNQGRILVWVRSKNLTQIDSATINQIIGKISNLAPLEIRDYEELRQMGKYEADIKIQVNEVLGINYNRIG